jgi:ABC-type polysaccharide/polyol phosphate export permease
MNPLMQTLVMWFVFSKFGRIEEKNYALFLLSAIMVWTFLSQSILHSLTAIVSRRSLMMRIYIPKLVFPFASVTSNLINLAFFLIAYLVIALFTPVVGWDPAIVFIVPIILMMYLMATGAALAFSALNVFFRDFTHLTDVLLRVLFYLTPIIYPRDLFGPQIAFFLQFNPVSIPVLMARDVLYYHEVPSLNDWLVGYGVSGLIFVIGLTIFVKNQDRFIYYA